MLAHVYRGRPSALEHTGDGGFTAIYLDERVPLGAVAPGR